jgi:hypothetical protein
LEWLFGGSTTVTDLLSQGPKGPMWPLQHRCDEARICMRCGDPSCGWPQSDGEVQPCALGEFESVHALTTLDDDRGQALFGYKRWGSTRDAADALFGILLPLVSYVADLCDELPVTNVVLVPYSMESHQSGRWHPNLLLFEGLKARLCRGSKTKTAVWVGRHAGKSRSLARRQSVLHRLRKQNLGPMGPAAQAHIGMAWGQEVVWLGDGVSRQTASAPRMADGVTIFVDDVLTTGCSATQIAVALDPLQLSRWVLVAACRTVSRDRSAS